MGVHVKYTLFCQMLIKLAFVMDFLKSSNAEFNKNTSIWSGVVPCDQKDGRTGGRTEIVNVIVAFRNFGEAPNSEKVMCMYA